MIEDAEHEFERAIDHADNLIELHRRGRQGQGRRFAEMSLNRAVVVLTVAAWQAYIERLVDEVLDYMSIPQGAQGHNAYLVLRADVSNHVQNFSTPNAENTLRLLARVGFNPRANWTWTEGSLTIMPPLACDRINQWLRIRHAVAHGDSALPQEPVLPVLPSGNATLRRGEAEECMLFFTVLVDQTTKAARIQFP
jgi:hypothetical protein